MSHSAALRLVRSPTRGVKPTLTELEILLEEYLITAKADGLSRFTLQTYEWHLRQLLDWLRNRGVVGPQRVTRLILREWASGLYDRWETATIKVAITACRSYFKWAWKERFAADNPAEALRIPQPKLSPQRTISKAEFERMVNLCDRRPIGLRNAALVSLLFDSGLRSAELCRLRMDDLNIASCEFVVRIKGGAVLPGWFGQKTQARLEDWLAMRVALPDVTTVFVGIGGTTPGGPMTPDGLRVVLRELGKRAGFERVSPHAFRRGFAVALSAAGISDNVLKDLGRWATTQMIRRYTLAQRVGSLYQSPVDANTDS